MTYLEYSVGQHTRELQIIDHFVEGFKADPECRPEVIALKQRESALANIFMEATWEVKANGNRDEIPTMETAWRGLVAVRRELSQLGDLPREE